MVDIVNGRPGKAIQVSGTGILQNVVCPAANYCIASGLDAAFLRVVFVQIVGGVPRTPQPVPFGDDYAIGCGSSTSCWITGAKTSTAMHGVIVTLAKGRVASVRRSRVGFYRALACTPRKIKPSVYDATCRGRSCLAVGTMGGYPGEGALYRFS